MTDRAATRATTAASQRIRWVGLGLLLAVGCVNLPPHLIELREAREELAVGNPEAARAGFERVLVVEPGNSDALRGLAESQIALGQPAAALETLDVLAERSPGALDAELRRARCDALLAALESALDAGEPDRAIELAESSAAAQQCASDRLTALDVDARLAAAGAASATGEASAAFDHWSYVLGVRPGDADATLGAAVQLIREGRRDDALELLSEALAQHPKDGRLVELTVDVLAGP